MFRNHKNGPSRNERDVEMIFFYIEWHCYENCIAECKIIMNNCLLFILSALEIEHKKQYHENFLFALINKHFKSFFF